MDLDGMADTAALGRRERNKLRTRSRIYEAAIALFAEDGYAATSVDAIAERADIARATFFNYFQRKDDLVTQWAAQRRDRLRAALEVEASGEPDGVTRLLRRAVRLLATMNEQEGRAAVVMIRAYVETGQPVIEEPYAAHLFAQLVALGQQRGEFDPAADAEQCGHLVRDAYFGVLYRWSRNGGGPLASELNAIFDLLLCGILVRADRL